MTCAPTGVRPVVEGGRAVCARESRLARDGVREPLRAIPRVDHHAFRDLDRRRVRRVQEEHRRRRPRVELALALAAQQVAHRDRHVAEIDVDRARIDALVADRAVVGHVAEFVEVAQREATPRLLLVEKRLGQERRGEDLVARTVEQVRAR